LSKKYNCDIVKGIIYKFFAEGVISYMKLIRIFVLACCALIALSVNAAEISLEAKKFAKKSDSIKVSAQRRK